MSANQDRKTVSGNGKSISSHEEAMQSIADGIHSFKSIREMLGSLKAELSKLFDCDSVTIFSLDRDRRILYSRNFDAGENPDIRVQVSTDNLAGFVAATGKPLNIADAYSPEELSLYHPKLKHGTVWDEMLGSKTKSLMVIPLAHNKKLVGVMEIINKQNGGMFSEEDFRSAKTLSHMVGLLLAKLEFEELEQSRPSKDKTRVEDLVHNVSQALHSAKDVDQILLRVKDDILQLFDAVHITVYAVDDDRAELFSKAKTSEHIQEIRLPIDASSIAGCVAMERRMVNIADVRDPNELRQYHPDLQFSEAWDKEAQGNAKVMLVFPLVYKNRLMGVLQLINKTSGESFNGMDEKNAFLIAETLSLALYNQRKFVERKPTKFDYLIQHGILAKQELVSAIAKARERGVDLETFLQEETGVSRPDLGKSFENFFKVPYQGYNGSLELPGAEDLDVDSLSALRWVPLKKDDSEVLVLANDPADPRMAEMVQSLFAPREVRFMVGLKADIRDFIDSIAKKGGREETGAAIPNIMVFKTGADDALHEEKSETAPREETEEAIAPETRREHPVVAREEPGNGEEEIDGVSAAGQINRLVLEAGRQGVSNIHIEWGADDALKVRFRKKGACRIYEEIPQGIGQSAVACLKTMAKLDLEEKVLPQNGKARLNVDSAQFEIRVATFPVVEGREDVVISILSASKPVPGFIPLAGLNLSPSNLERVRSALARANGLILATGAAGSGKTTTLHALLGFINSPDKKILTAEDPVEIKQQGLRQIKLDPQKGLTYPYAIRSFLLGDPDAIAAGAIPDAETLAMILDAASERLVLGAAESSSAAAALPRLIAMGADPGKLAELPALIVNQTLVETLCERCKTDYHPSREEFDALAGEFGAERFAELGIRYDSGLTLKKPAGCKLCVYSGYAGKTGLHEVLDATPEIWSLVRGGASEEAIRAKAVASGMTTLKQDGIVKVFQGACDLNQVLEACKA